MIYKKDTWHKYDTVNNKVQEVYCLSDMHAYEQTRPEQIIEFNNADQKQRAVLIEALQQIEKDKTLFIVEDPYSITNNTHPKIATYLPLLKPAWFAEPEGKRPPFLLFLGDILKSHQCDVVNAEPRQQRIISYLFYTQLVSLRQSRSPILKPFSINIKKLYGTTLQDIAKEFTDALNTIKQYQQTDGPVLADYYAEIIAKLESTQPFINLLQTTSPSLYFWDICDAANSTFLSDFLGSFLVWGLELVDAYALHALYNATDKEKVYLIMGGIHINNVSHLLPKLGYTKVATEGVDPLTEQDHTSLTTLRTELFAINQFVPAKPTTWIESFTKKVTGIWSNNILARTVTMDTKKMDTFKRLAAKLSYVKPVDEATWKKITAEKQ